LLLALSRSKEFWLCGDAENKNDCELRNGAAKIECFRVHSVVDDVIVPHALSKLCSGTWQFYPGSCNRYLDKTLPGATQQELPPNFRNPQEFLASIKNPVIAFAVITDIALNQTVKLKV